MLVAKIASKILKAKVLSAMKILKQIILPKNPQGEDPLEMYLNPADKKKSDGKNLVT